MAEPGSNKTSDAPVATYSTMDDSTNVAASKRDMTSVYDVARLPSASTKWPAANIATRRHNLERGDMVAPNV